MSTEETVSDQPVSAPTKKRSPIERLLVWGFIVFLGVAVALEYRGMEGYNQTLKALEDQLDESRLDPTKVFSLKEAKSLGKMGPSFSAPAEKNGSFESKVSWFTFLSFMPDREYTIYLGLGGTQEDAAVTSITTAGHRAMENQIMNGGQ